MAALASPRWRIAHEISLPTGVEVQERLRYLSVVKLVFMSSIVLRNLTEPSPTYHTYPYGSSRSLGEEQVGIFHALESSLAGVGVDGRACLLKLICHLQSRPIGQYTVVGELLTLLFTPKHEANEFLKEYQEAEMAGLDGADCSYLYPSCPFSLPFTLLPPLQEDTGMSVSSPGHSLSSSPLRDLNRDLTLPEVTIN